MSPRLFFTHCEALLVSHGDIQLFLQASNQINVLMASPLFQVNLLEIKHVLHQMKS